MSQSPPSVGVTGHATEVMAAVDTDGHVPRLVIADITRDGTWLSIPVSAAASLTDWR